MFLSAHQKISRKLKVHLLTIIGRFGESLHSAHRGLALQTRSCKEGYHFIGLMFIYFCCFWGWFWLTTIMVACSSQTVCVWYFLVVAVLRTQLNYYHGNFYKHFFAFLLLLFSFSALFLFVCSVCRFFFLSSSSLSSSSSFSLFGFLFLFICLVFRNYSLPAHCLRLIARLILHITWRKPVFPPSVQLPRVLMRNLDLTCVTLSVHHFCLSLTHTPYTSTLYCLRLFLLSILNSLSVRVHVVLCACKCLYACEARTYMHECAYTTCARVCKNQSS